MTASIPARPRDWSVSPADVLMADGSIAGIRALEVGDRDELLALHEGVSEDTLRLRFFTTSPAAGRAYVAHLFDETNARSVALVAVVRGRIAALATAELLSSESAEVAFLVSDQDRGRGLGSLLLEHLAALGREHGVSRFEAEVLADNRGMLGVFRGAGFSVKHKSLEGEVHVELLTDASTAAIEAADRREWQSEARSLRPLLYPSSVAVVGVRRDASGFGYGLVESIRSGGFSGQLYVVHPEAEVIDGIPTRRSLDAVGASIDLAVIAVPASRVLEVMTDAVAAEVKAAIVVSSGFSDIGRVRAPLQHDLLELARKNSIRLIGPNSQGVLCTAEEVCLNATFAGALPSPGGLAVASQSGGVGLAMLDLAEGMNVGVHAYVSLGSKLDVSSNDLLAAWMSDPEVTAAALYLESFGNALKFARTARRFAERKPILAVVGQPNRQRTETADVALRAPAAVGVDALFAQSGVIRCRTATEMAETAALLVQQPLPAGYRVAFISNTGGMGIVAADLAHAEGLAVPELSTAFQTRLSEVVEEAVDVRNPVDLGLEVTPASLGACLRLLIDSPDTDAIVVLLVATRLNDPNGLLAALAQARLKRPEMPVVLVGVGEFSSPADGITVFRTPEAAVGALGRSMRYAAWQRVPADQPAMGMKARATFARDWADNRLTRLSGQAEWLPAGAATELLAPYGIKELGALVNDGTGACDAAESIGYPVVVKAADPAIRHKTDRGLVRVGLSTPDEVVAAVEAFQAELSSDAVEVRVQPVCLGVEIACGLVRDDVFGPLVRVAAGGVATELWRDEVFLLPPIGPSDAARALRGLRLWPMLEGFRGSQPVDVAALQAMVVAVGQLAIEVPHLADLDLNPLVASPSGVYCVDVKVRLRVPTARDAGIPRRLRPLA